MKVFFRIIIFFLSIFISNTKIFACTCDVPSIKEAYSNSQLIFKGKVIKVKPLFVTDSLLKDSITNDFRYKVGQFLGYETTFEVSENLKSNIKGNIVIFSKGGAPSCGYRFIEGKEYLVYAFATKKFDLIVKQDDFYYTGMCSRTTSYSRQLKNEIEEIKSLSKT